MRDTRADTKSSPARASARFLARHPRSVGSLAGTEALMLWVGYHTVLITAAIAVVAGASWRLLDQPSFDRFAGRVLRAWWRRWAVYQRQWHRIVCTTGLASADHHGHQRNPKVVRARSTWCWDTLEVRMTKGQEQADYEAVLNRLANAYRARRATVRTLKPGTIALNFQRREPFDDLFIPLPELADSTDAVDLSRLPIGADEYGRDFALDLHQGLHILLAGATGAGKGSWIWGLLRALAPMIREGSVRLWVIDPKGGMEFGAGQPMFHRYADTDRDGLALTEEFAAVLDQRKHDLGRQGVRQHTPTVEQPLELLICDELSAMTEYTDRDIARPFESLLSKALTQYRAVGGRVLGAVQDPEKDTVPMRGLFPTKIALRLEEASQVDMTLGEGMRDKGAFADHIPEFLPGVGYVKHDHRREPLRVRAAYTTDADIAALVTYCTTPAPVKATVTPLHPDDTAAVGASVEAATATETDVEEIEHFDGDDHDEHEEIA